MSDLDVGRDTASNSDAHGRAALLLIESLIHGLAEHSILTVREALDIMEVALETQQAMDHDALQPSPAMKEAMALLASMIASLEADVSD